MVPLLMIERTLRGQEDSWKQVFRHGYQAFIIWNILSTYWVANAAVPAGIFAVVVNSLLMTLPLVLYHLAVMRMPRTGYAALIAFWMTFEYLHLNWDLNWPWLNLGNGFAEYPGWIQWYAWTGTFGGTLWILAANVLIFRAVRSWQEGQRSWRVFLPSLGTIVIPILLSQILLFGYTPPAEESARVAIIQPNIEPHYGYRTLSREAQFDRFLELSLDALRRAPETEYLVFPEASFDASRERRLDSDPIVNRLRAALADYPDLVLVMGVSAYRLVEPGEPKPEAVRRVERRDGSILEYEALNAAVQVPIDGDSVQVYRKSKLVPGPESFPFRRFLFFLEPIMEAFGATSAGLGTQAERSVFTSDHGAVAPIICYESVFGEYFGGYVRRGAQAGFVMTNDGWWDHTAGHRQHLHFSSLRAIETRRAFIRSANTGISAVIDPTGRIEQRTNYDEPAFLLASIPLNDQITFYTRWGDLLARIALLAALAFLLNLVAKTWLRRAQRADR